MSTWAIVRSSAGFEKRLHRLGGESVVVTFEPHPLKLFPRLNDLRLITTYAEKEGLIESSGIDYLITIPFTEEFAALSAADFVSGILVDLIGLKKLIIGYDYAFGRNREGNVALLREMGHRCGFDLEVLEPIGDGREDIQQHQNTGNDRGRRCQRGCCTIGASSFH